MASMEDGNQHTASVEIEHRRAMPNSYTIFYICVILPFSFQSGSAGVVTGTRSGGLYVFTIVNIVGGRVYTMRPFWWVTAEMGKITMFWLLLLLSLVEQFLIENACRFLWKIKNYTIFLN